MKSRGIKMFYRVTPIAVIGGSFLSGLSGHNISEAAAAGCAVVTDTSKVYLPTLFSIFL
jgi:3-deoxy-D-manno-octulosonic-acid transferase